MAVNETGEVEQRLLPLPRDSLSVGASIRPSQHAIVIARYQIETFVVVGQP